MKRKERHEQARFDEQGSPTSTASMRERLKEFRELWMKKSIALAQKIELASVEKSRSFLRKNTGYDESDANGEIENHEKI